MKAIKHKEKRRKGMESKTGKWRLMLSHREMNRRDEGLHLSNGGEEEKWADQQGFLLI